MDIRKAKTNHVTKHYEDDYIMSHLTSTKRIEFLLSFEHPYEHCWHLTDRLTDGLFLLVLHNMLARKRAAGRINEYKHTQAHLWKANKNKNNKYIIPFMWCECMAITTIWKTLKETHDNDIKHKIIQNLWIDINIAY